MKIISIANHKGGVGKTTSTINIGAGLALKNKKVLLVDLDPQANLSQSLGVVHSEYTIYSSLMGKNPLKPISIIENLDLIPSTLDLSGAELELSSEAGREYILSEILDDVKNSYDYILIDCPPSLGLLTINAFTASNEIIIATQAQYLATQGLVKLSEVIEKIKKRLNKGLILKGIVITQYDSRKVLNRDVVKMIEEHFKGKVFNTKVRDNVALAEAPVMKTDIFRYNPKSNGAEDYAALTEEILNNK